MLLYFEKKVALIRHHPHSVLFALLISSVRIWLSIKIGSLLLKTLIKRKRAFFFTEFVHMYYSNTLPYELPNFVSDIFLIIKLLIRTFPTLRTLFSSPRENSELHLIRLECNVYRNRWLKTRIHINAPYNYNLKVKSVTG